MRRQAVRTFYFYAAVFGKIGVGSGAQQRLRELKARLGNRLAQKAAARLPVRGNKAPAQQRAQSGQVISLDCVARGDQMLEKVADRLGFLTPDLDEASKLEKRERLRACRDTLGGSRRRLAVS